GTITDCVSGKANYFSYYAIGAASYSSTLAVAAGDQMSATLTHTSGSHYLTVTLRDLTKATSTTNHGLVTLGKHTDAMWADEVVSTSTGTPHPLVDFGTVAFTSCIATING